MDCGWISYIVVMFITSVPSFICEMTTHMSRKPLHIENSCLFEMEIVMHEGQLSASLPEYNPNKLLDAMLEKLELKNDAALSRALEIAPPLISKIRHRRLPVGASMLIRMHEVSNLSVMELRELLGDRRAKFRISSAQGMQKKVLACTSRLGNRRMRYR
jgi:hypothetical protein